MPTMVGPLTSRRTPGGPRPAPAVLAVLVGARRRRARLVVVVATAVVVVAAVVVIAAAAAVVGADDARERRRLGRGGLALDDRAVGDVAGDRVAVVQRDGQHPTG